MDPFPPAQGVSRLSRLSALTSIFGIYTDHTRDLTLACRKGCASCCTCNVTVTALETAGILDYMAATGQHDRLFGLDTSQNPSRFRPQMTTNEMARRCAYGEDVLPAANVSGQGRCPLLVNDLCAIYPARPFGCRCLISMQDCRQTGYAQIDDYTLTLNSVFLQYIEHLDAGGRWGNLIDMLFARRHPILAGSHMDFREQSPASNLMVSQPISVLMVPPKHRSRIRPILAQLSRVVSEA